MIQLTKTIPNLYIGDYEDEKHAKVCTILNVANDLIPTRGWHWGIEYAHIGLIDGPGNTTALYSAAVLALHSLVSNSEDKILVCCHSGGRSMAVAVMYLIIKRGKRADHPTFLNYWTPWDRVVEELHNQCDIQLPGIHEAHKTAFEKLPLSLIEGLM